MKQFYFLAVLSLGFFTALCIEGPAKSGCLEKQKALALLEMAENLLTKASNSIPYCKEDINSTDQSECGEKKPLAYIELSKKFISDVRKNFPTCPAVITPAKFDKPKDCTEILESGQRENGIYTIWPKETRKPLQVFCDMQADEGGWTVIQRRGKFAIQQDFNLDFESYKKGFGNISEEFWLGNENIRVLCQEGCKIRFDLQDEKGEKGLAIYQNFTLSSSNYTLAISGYSGNVGDSMKYHDKHDFSTKDKGDTVRAIKYGGGWWHGQGGYYGNLNGIYNPGQDNTYETVGWYTWRRTKNLARAEIKVRPD